MQTSTKLDLDAIEARVNAQNNAIPDGGSVHEMLMGDGLEMFNDDCLALIARVRELEATVAAQNDIMGQAFGNKLETKEEPCNC